MWHPNSKDYRGLGDIELNIIVFNDVKHITGSWIWFNCNSYLKDKRYKLFVFLRKYILYKFSFVCQFTVKVCGNALLKKITHNEKPFQSALNFGPNQGTLKIVFKNSGGSDINSFL